VDAQAALSPQPGGFENLLGLEVGELGDELARGRVPVAVQLTEASGAVHGGVFAAIAQDLVARATATALAGGGAREGGGPREDEGGGPREDEGGAGGRGAVGLSNQTTFLRPIFDGEIRAVARRRHRGRSTWVWEVEMTDHQDQLCAFSRVTVAVRV
jgi:acyl-coenzyme A thioesterase PaaI-like protein